MSKDDDISAAVKNPLVQSVLHTSEARRLTAELAESRGVPIPESTSTGFEDIAEEITGMHAEIQDLARAERERSRGPSGVHVHIDSQPDSDGPPSTNVSFKGPGGLGARHISQWVFLILALAGMLIAGAAYVVGQIVAHPVPASVPK